MTKEDLAGIILEMNYGAFKEVADELFRELKYINSAEHFAPALFDWAKRGKRT